MVQINIDSVPQILVRDQLIRDEMNSDRIFWTYNNSLSTNLSVARCYVQISRVPCSHF